MNRALDFLRLVFVSPEVLFALIPLAIYAYVPTWADVFVKPMTEGIGWGLAAAGSTLGMLAFSYKEGFELCGKKVVLEWPDYPMLKTRVLVACTWCLMGAVACFIAAWMVVKDIHTLLAVTILISGWVAAATATVTVALARFSLREIVGE